MFRQQLGMGSGSQDLGDRSEGTIARDHPLFLKLRRSYMGSKPWLPVFMRRNVESDWNMSVAMKSRTCPRYPTM